MASFSIPLSGLAASTQALDIISNNLANLNTVGYKDQSANFQDLFYQNIGSDGAGDPIQVGAGTSVGSVATNFSDGSLQNTSISSNAAITGNGFFVTQDAQGTVQYTRAGDFTVNSAGQLVTSGGQTVMGYPSLNGVVNQAAVLSPLNVGSGASSPPSATTTMQQQTNLNAAATVGTPYSTTQAVYDSLGESHLLTFNYTMTAANTWTYQVTLPAADTGGTGAPTALATGTLSFDSNGNLTSPTGSLPVAITGLADGAANMSAAWSLTTPSGSSLLTQVASAASTTTTELQNGFAAGTLSDFTIMQDGTIQGQFSNGQTQALGQIALASFANDDGLEATAGNSYDSTLASGAAVIGAANSGGRGTLTGGSVELSNVDISTEFTNLIVVQRGFEADSRVVTTFDSVGQSTTNLQASPGN
ncbi:MAG: flagellar hook protein FlgE [Candidatus Sulfotelmatobacter sp.]|jgi:flagellar hook protein FlgE